MSTSGSNRRVGLLLPQAIRLTRAHGLCLVSMNGGRARWAIVSWNATLTARTSLTRDSSASPGTICHAFQHSATHAPDAVRIGRGVRNLADCSVGSSTSERKAASSAESDGRRMTDPARQVRPRPPSNLLAETGPAPNAADTSAGGRSNRAMTSSMKDRCARARASIAILATTYCSPTCGLRMRTAPTSQNRRRPITHQKASKRRCTNSYFDGWRRRLLVPAAKKLR